MEQDKFNKIDTRLLKRYLEGKGNIEEQQQIDQWFSELRSVEELRKFSEKRWKDLPSDISIPGYDEYRLQDKIHHILRLEDAVEFKKERTPPRLLLILTRIAAVLFLPLAFFTLINWRGNIIEKEQSAAFAEIYSPFGARTSFVLPDGTSGWLNGGSTLSFPTKFKEKSRNVELNGEAYFNVLTNPEKPFTVDANRMKVRAYGTSFNVMTFPEDDVTEVTLESGVIEVFGIDNYDIEKSMGKMVAGERGVLTKRTGIFKKEMVQVERYTSWKEGKLVFRNESMIQAVKKMNRWYNVNIIIKDKHLESYTYRATFVDEKLDEVLKIFKRTSPIVYKEMGRDRFPDGTYGKRTIELYHRSNN